MLFILSIDEHQYLKKFLFIYSTVERRTAYTIRKQKIIGDYFNLLITSRRTPKDDEHTQIFISKDDIQKEKEE